MSPLMLGRTRTARTALVLTAATALLFTAAACGDDDDNNNSSGSSASTASEPIALLLPESKTARYEAHDRPEFVAAYKELCPNSEVLYSNANQDAAKQLQQAEAALTNGAKVLVLDPVDSASAGTIVSKARSQGVDVVSYDRLITGTAPDSYVSYDNEKVGQLQGESLLKALDAEGSGKKTIVMINGSPTDNNATLFKKGAHSVLDGKVTIGREYDTTDWSPDVAQKEMEQAITALGKSTIDGVLAANDGTAGGAIAAMTAAGFDPIPPTTGQDAELAAIQRIVTGDQYMTIYKGTKAETQVAAEFACAALNGTDPTTSPAATDVDGIPTVLLDPVVVTKDNIKDTVVADGYWTIDDICTKQYAAACKSAGLT